MLRVKVGSKEGDGAEGWENGGGEVSALGGEAQQAEGVGAELLVNVAWENAHIVDAGVDRVAVLARHSERVAVHLQVMVGEGVGDAGVMSVI